MDEQVAERQILHGWNPSARTLLGRKATGAPIRSRMDPIREIHHVGTCSERQNAGRDRGWSITSRMYPVREIINGPGIATDGIHPRDLRHWSTSSRMEPICEAFDNHRHRHGWIPSARPSTTLDIVMDGSHLREVARVGWRRGEWDGVKVAGTSDVADGSRSRGVCGKM